MSGIGDMESAFLLTISAFVGAPVIILTGRILEKVAVNQLLSIAYVMQGICCIQMIFMRNMVQATLCGIVWGLSTGIL